MRIRVCRLKYPLQMTTAKGSQSEWHQVNHPEVIPDPSPVLYPERSQKGPSQNRPKSFAKKPNQFRVQFAITSFPDLSSKKCCPKWTNWSQFKPNFVTVTLHQGLVKNFIALTVTNLYLLTRIKAGNENLPLPG